MAKIGRNQHVFIAGGTGTGKTFLMQYFLSTNEKLTLILDTKGTFEWPHVLPEHKALIRTFAELPQAIADGYKRIIYRPIYQELNDDYYNQFLMYAYNLGNCTVGIDEVKQVTHSASESGMVEGYKAILTRGRELGVNVWSASQRPSSIPVVVYSESSHWFIFRLNAKPDRARIAEYTGYEQFENPVTGHDFWYYDADENTSPVLSKLKVKGG